MKLTAIRDALLTVGIPVNHFEALKKGDQYIVWAEDGQENALHAGGRMVRQSITGTIDYFTKTEYDPNFAAIQRALNDAGIPFRLNSTQFEEKTGYVHYEWVWTIDGTDLV